MIRSLKNQVLIDKTELVFVDNNSEDRTILKINHFCSKFKIKYIVLSYDSTIFIPGRALNIGIQNAKGKYCVILSAHCIPISNNWLKSLVNSLTDMIK